MRVARGRRPLAPRRLRRRRRRPAGPRQATHWLTFSPAPAFAAAQAGSIAELAASSNDTTILLAAVQAAGLDELLSGEPPSLRRRSIHSGMQREFPTCVALPGRCCLTQQWFVMQCDAECFSLLPLLLPF